MISGKDDTSHVSVFGSLVDAQAYIDRIPFGVAKKLRIAEYHLAQAYGAYGEVAK